MTLRASILVLLLATLTAGASQQQDVLMGAAYKVRGAVSSSLPGLSQGLVALYHFNPSNPWKDEVTGGNGSNVNVVCTNNAVLGSGSVYTAGTSGSGFWTLNASLLSNKPSGSCTFWVRVIGTPAFGSPFVMNNGASYEIGVLGDNQVGSRVRFWNYPYYIASSNNTYTIGTWVHMAWVYSKAARMEFYTNGVIAATNASPPNVNLLMQKQFCVGVDPSSTSSVLQEMVDELAFYTNALTAAQIKAIYDANLSGTEIKP